MRRWILVLGFVALPAVADEWNHPTPPPPVYVAPPPVPAEGYYPPPGLLPTSRPVVPAIPPDGPVVLQPQPGQVIWLPIIVPPAPEKESPGHR